MHQIVAGLYGFAEAHPRRTGGGLQPASLCAFAARLAALAYGVAASELTSVRRLPRRATTARQVGIYLAHTTAGLPLVMVADFFGRDRTTAAYACRLVEDRRDDGAFDAELSELEDLLRAISGDVQ